MSTDADRPGPEGSVTARASADFFNGVDAADAGALGGPEPIGRVSPAPANRAVPRHHDIHAWAIRHGHQHTHEHHFLIEPEEDRWRWRRKIRENPRRLAVYRVGVAIAGLLFVVLGVVTGPLPGPGGIPLVLLGLAIWSSEFEWAHKLMLVFKAQLVRFRSWTRPKQALFWVVFFSCCGLFGYLYMLVMGVPVWLPAGIVVLLHRLPGL